MQTYVIKKKSTGVDIIQGDSKVSLENSLRNYLNRTSKDKYDYCIVKQIGSSQLIVTEGSNL